MAGNDQDLLSYNQHGALSHCLAIEDHLASLPPGVNNSWCAKKHAMLACGHHLAEAINHASRIDPQLGDRYRDLKDQAVKVLRPGMNEPLPELGKVAAFRNHMRRVFGDPSLTQSCSVCAKDNSMGSLDVGSPNWLLLALAGLIGISLWKKAPLRLS